MTYSWPASDKMLCMIVLSCDQGSPMHLYHMPSQAHSPILVLPHQVWHAAISILFWCVVMCSKFVVGGKCDVTHLHVCVEGKIISVGVVTLL